MKILITGDLHLRVRAPEKRKDKDFLNTCLGKFEQILEIYKNQGCDAMIQPGDFFDSPNPSGELLAEMIELLRDKARLSSNPRLFVICGQHDLSYHTEASARKSALRIMEAAEVLSVLWKVQLADYDDFYVHGAMFGQDHPPGQVEKNKYNILVAHAMVGHKKLWPTQQLTGPRKYMKEHPGYQLYIFGDYHYSFQVKVNNTWAINAGCMLRLTASRRDLKHRPKVVIFDTEKNEPTDIYLDIKLTEEVFDLSAVSEKQSPGFAKFVNRLESQGKIGVSFKDNLAAYFGAEKTPENIREIIWGSLG